MLGNIILVPRKQLEHTTVGNNLSKNLRSKAHTLILLHTQNLYKPFDNYVYNVHQRKVLTITRKTVLLILSSPILRNLRMIIKLSQTIISTAEPTPTPPPE